VEFYGVIPGRIDWPPYNEQYWPRYPLMSELSSLSVEAEPIRHPSVKIDMLAMLETSLIAFV
jgi:hypothetical protein